MDQQFLIEEIDTPFFFKNTGYILFGCYLALISSCESTYSYTTEKTDYNYTFNVHPVDRCPMNESEWQAATTRTGCNSTRGYHCVPDKFHSKLIEFCYIKTRNLVADGNCLELAANGILNHVKCQNFTMGCPDKPYMSDEIYRYPACLYIEFGCFTSDKKCLHEKFADLQTLTRERISNSIQTDNGFLTTIFIIILVLLVIILLTLVIVYILCRYRKKWRKRVDSNEEQEQMIVKESKAEKRVIKESEAEKRVDGKEEREIMIIKESEAEKRVESNEEQEIKKKSAERGPKKSVFPADLNVLGEVESELIVDITYLSQLLRRHCRNGTFKNFEYLLNRRILDKKHDEKLQRILTSHDKDGYTLLHCAAEGGSKDIFTALINATDEIKVDDTTHDGRTVLHIACKNNHNSLCRFLLLDNYEKDLLPMKTHTDWSAAHFAAAGGSIQILNLLEDKGLDITEKTKNGLNILDIACLHGHEGLCQDLMGRDLNLPLNKTDAHGWTIAHFAAMVGMYNVIDHLIEKKYCTVEN